MTQADADPQYTILVVDDEPISRKLIESTLRKADYGVVTVANGRAALDAMQDRFFPMVLTDWVMPEMDGVELCRAIRDQAESSYVFIILLTSNDSQDDIIAGLEALRLAFSGQIWLEIFLVEGLNTSEANLKGIRQAIKRIRPDKVQLNTAVRPTAQIGIPHMTADRMEHIAQQIGHDCEIIASFSHPPSAPMHRDSRDVMTMLRRRPCSLDDICASLGMNPKRALHELSSLLSQGHIQSEDRSGVLFYLANEVG